MLKIISHGNFISFTFIPHQHHFFSRHMFMFMYLEKSGLGFTVDSFISGFSTRRARLQSRRFKGKPHINSSFYLEDLLILD